MKKIVFNIKLGFITRIVSFKKLIFLYLFIRAIFKSLIFIYIYIMEYFIFIQLKRIILTSFQYQDIISIFNWILLKKFNHWIITMQRVVSGSWTKKHPTKLPSTNEQYVFYLKKNRNNIKKYLRRSSKIRNLVSKKTPFIKDSQTV